MPYPTPTRLKRPLLTLIVAWLTGAAAFAAPAAPPRLIVFLAIDGLPQRQLLAVRHLLTPDGFNRFLQRGTWFAQAHYGHAFTVTGAGHATMLSGAYPEQSGIIGNEWRDAATGERVYCTGDRAAHYIDHPTQPLDGTSPGNLKVETVGDVLRRLHPAAKVLAVSGKDRGAILPAGHRGTAYMYMLGTGRFASSTYYMSTHPAWVNAFNARRLADRYFRAQWQALLPDSAYGGALADQQPWFGPAGGALPMAYSAPDDAMPGPNFYASLLRGPFADALTLEFARAALAGEDLGADATPDLLSISLSGHDYVNHAYSAESRLSHDHLLQLDRLLQAFFADLDARLGLDGYVAVLTADHGFTPAVPYSQSLGHDAGQTHPGAAMAAVEQALTERFGPGRWTLGFSGATVLLDRARLQRAGHALDDAAELARQALLAQPGIALAYTGKELRTGQTAHPSPWFAALRRAWNPAVSGDVQFALKPLWSFGTRAVGAVHGSPYAYDTHVPLLWYGPRWLGAAQVAQRADVVDVAPTLAHLLGIPAPNGNQGVRLPLPPPTQTAAPTSHKKRH